MPDPTREESARCACPKCGETENYNPMQGFEEYLDWICSRCDFQWRTSTDGFVTFTPAPRTVRARDES